MPAVFISYRREDSSGYAGRLFDIFCTHFGRKNTFMDLDAIHGGDNFAAVIEEKICVTDALVAVIGSHWLTVADDKGNRRLNNPADFVRLEIGKALRRGIRVIPILVGGATIPHPADLPEDLQPLCQRQAVEIRDAHFHQDVEQLIDVLHNAPRSAGFWREKFGSRRIAWLLLPGLIAVVVVLAVLFFRRSTAIPTTPTLSTNVQTNDPTKSKAPVDISGNWTAPVRYDWGATYSEAFQFDVNGHEVSGTASFLGNRPGQERGILDGKIEGNRVSFTTKSLSMAGSEGNSYEEKHHYEGTIENDAIRFTMTTDSPIQPHAPIHFIAIKAKRN